MTKPTPDSSSSFNFNNVLITSAVVILLVITIAIVFISRLADSPTAWQYLIEHHLAKYPQMEITDVYKLVYQGTGGPAHLGGNPDSIAADIESELAQVEAAPEELIERICPNNKYIRINLKSFKLQQGDVHRLAEIIAASAPTNPEWKTAFIHRWEIVGQLIQQDKLPFTVQDYSDLTTQVAQQNYPPVHHSRAYITTYQPAYRVVARKIWEKQPACRLD